MSKHGIRNIVRVNNLMYEGCEPHWKCKNCGKCVPFHCYTKEQFAELECKFIAESERRKK